MKDPLYPHSDGHQLHHKPREAGEITAVQRKFLAKAMQADSPQQVAPFVNQLEIYHLLNSSCREHSVHIPRMTQLANAIMHAQQNMGQQFQSASDISAEDTRLFLKCFLAGVQYAYDKAPWEQLSDQHDLAFIITDKYLDLLDQGLAPEGNVGFMANIRAIPKSDGSQQYALELDICALAAIMGRKMDTINAWCQNTEDNEISPHHIAFALGVEEGRHLSQLFNPEVNKVVMPAIEQHYDDFDTRNKAVNAPGGIDYGQDPAELDTLDFIREHYEDIRQKADAIHQAQARGR